MPKGFKNWNPFPARATSRILRKHYGLVSTAPQYVAAEPNRITKESEHRAPIRELQNPTEQQKKEVWLSPRRQKWPKRLCQKGFAEKVLPKRALCAQKREELELSAALVRPSAFPKTCNDGFLPIFPETPTKASSTSGDSSEDQPIF